MKEHGRLAALRKMLWEMEVDLGLAKLSQHQRDVFYAACLVANDDKLVYSENIRQHPLLSLMARPTFYRALSELVEKGMLSVVGVRKDGRYRLEN